MREQSKCLGTTNRSHNPRLQRTRSARRRAVTLCTTMYKLGHLISEHWVEHSFAPVFRMPAAEAEAQRLVAGAPAGDCSVFERLVMCLEAPYFLLYVLHTPRGEGEPGRYQSPLLSADQVTAFLSEYRSFLVADARFDIWAHSPAEQATVVWDRHNQIFAYGPLTKFATELRAIGFSEGSPDLPFPHEHNYRSEYDQDSRSLLQAFNWSYSPLHSEDEQ